MNTGSKFKKVIIKLNFLKKISLINLFILICCICLNKISNSVWISEINSENPLNLFCTMSTVKACNKSEQYAEFEFLSTNEMSFNFSFHDWQSNNIILNYDINNFPSLIDIFFNNGLSTKKIKFSNFKFEGKNARAC